MSAAATKHQFSMAMTCEGCIGAAKRVLKKIGVEDVEADLASKTVTVTSALPVDQILETLKNTGKEITYIGKAE